MSDATLAFLHHLAAFGLVAAQAVETTTLRGPLDAPRLERLALVDRLYLGALALVVVAGTLRVLAGPKGAAFYAGNPAFWAKVALVVAIVALAVPPARRYRAWRASARRDPGATPSADEVARMRRLVLLAAHAVLGVLVAATLMARGIGL